MVLPSIDVIIIIIIIAVVVIVILVVYLVSADSTFRFFKKFAGKG